MHLGKDPVQPKKKVAKLSNPNPDAQLYPTLQPHVCSLPDSIVHGIFPGMNTGVGCHFLFQGILLIQGSNPYLLCLLHWESDSLSLHYLSYAVLCLVSQLCLTLYDHMDCSPPGSSVHGDSPGKNKGVACHTPIQGIFPTQELNPGLPHCRWILYHLSPGSVRLLPNLSDLKSSCSLVSPIRCLSQVGKGTLLIGGTQKLKRMIILPLKFCSLLFSE